MSISSIWVVCCYPSKSSTVFYENDDVPQKIHLHQLYIWCGSLLDNVCFGISVSQALRENTYPFLAMIMLKDRRMTVVGRLEGLIQSEDLINQLTFIMDANQTHLMSERLER